MKRQDAGLRRLVAELDVDGTPMAETWRAVGTAAAAQGSLRPSYSLVRRLVLARRARPREQVRPGASARQADVRLLGGTRERWRPRPREAARESTRRPERPSRRPAGHLRTWLGGTAALGLVGLLVAAAGLVFLSHKPRPPG